MEEGACTSFSAYIFTVTALFTLTFRHKNITNYKTVIQEAYISIYKTACKELD